MPQAQLIFELCTGTAPFLAQYKRLVRELQRHHRSTAKKRMVFSAGKHHSVLDCLFDDQIRLGDPALHQPDIQFAFQEPFLNDMCVRHKYLWLRDREFPAQPGDDRAHHTGADRDGCANAQVHPLCGFFEVTVHLLPKREKMPRVVKQFAAGAGQVEAPSQPLEQPHTVFPFDLGDRLADRRLGDVHFARGFAHTAAVGHFDENLQMSCRHVCLLNS